MSPSKKHWLTDRDLFRYLQCPHWPYWERFGDRRERERLTQAEEDHLTGRLTQEREIVRRMFGDLREISVNQPRQAAAETLAWMRQGAPVIYQGWLLHDDWLGRPTVLERRQGKSLLGDWHYVPHLVRRVYEVRKEQLAMLMFYREMLEAIQGRAPARSTVINANFERLEVNLDAFAQEFKGMIETLQRIRGGERPEPVYRKACVDTSPWGRACFRLAFERDDIALLFNVDVKRLRALRAQGVCTLHQAATMEPEQLEGRAPGFTLRSLETIQRQARSLLDQSVMIREPWVHETKGLEMHFDIESHPASDRDYLYGFWLLDVAGGRYQSFVAERPEEELAMWRAFLAWLPTLPAEYTVYHYADYEATRLGVLARRYGDEANPWLERFRSRFVDLKEAARHHAVFPLYFYSLKLICGLLGFSWRGRIKGGRASIGGYERWLATSDRRHLNDLLRYNQDDVMATAHLLAWLRRYARTRAIYPSPYPWLDSSDSV